MSALDELKSSEPKVNPQQVLMGKLFCVECDELIQPGEGYRIGMGSVDSGLEFIPALHLQCPREKLQRRELTFRQ